MGTKFMRRMVSLLLAAAMIMTSGMFVFAASPTVGKVTSVTSEGTNGGKNLNVWWKSSGKVDYYVVKCGSKKQTVKSGTTCSFKTTPGSTYTVTVTPYYKGKKGTSKTRYRWAKTSSITSVKKSGTKKFTVKWKKASGATSYKVYIYKNGKYTYLKTVSKTSTTVKVSKSGSYKFKVRACKGKYLGIKSPAKSGKC